MSVATAEDEIATPAGNGGGVERRGALRGVVDAIEHERPRWFIWVPVWLGSGIAAYFSLPVEPSAGVAAAVVVVCLALRLATPRGTVAGALMSALLASGIGFALAKSRTEWVRGPVLAGRIVGAQVRGFVELVEPKPQRGGRITIRVVSLGLLPPEALPRRVRVRTTGAITGFSPGDPVRIKATLSPPPAPALPGAYDFGRAAWFQSLGGVGFSMARLEPDATVGEPPWRLRAGWAVERVRAAIGARIVAALPGETGAIANALITGERGAISDKTNDAFRDSGLFHALSISGLHMAVMAGAIFWTLRLLLAMSARIALRYPIKKWAAVGAALGALFYLLISGSSPPTQRSYLMISIMFLAILLDRRALALRNIAISALLILVVFPESLLDLGFQMSYAAVGALVAAHEAIQAWRSRRLGVDDSELGAIGSVLRNGGRFFGGIALSTVIASLAVAPFGAYYFHTSQQYAILGNLLGLPICDLYVMPLALATLVAMPFGLEAIPLWLMGLGIDLLVAVARLVAGIPGAVASVQAIPELSFVAIVIGGIWLALWGSRWRMLGLVPIAVGLALAPFAAKPDLYIGQDGRAVAVRLPDGALSALPLKGRSFELARWLEYDGDPRAVGAVATGAGFRCDAVGCTASVKGIHVAVAHHPAAYADDCRDARVLVAPGGRPAACGGPELIIDAGALRAKGMHVGYVTPRGVATATVADARGLRPWTAAGLEAFAAHPPEGATRRPVRLPAFAPGAVFGDPQGAPAGGDGPDLIGDMLPDAGD